MTDDQKPGLDSIWPDVESEIRSARRRERRKRITRRAALLAALAFTTATAMRKSSAPSPRPDTATRPAPLPAITACDCRSWQITDVAPAVGIATHYPLVRDRRVFAVRGPEESRRIVCLDKRNGSLLWDCALPLSDCRLASDEKTLYALVRITDGAWRCIAFASATGEKLWDKPEGPFPLVPPSTLTTHADGVCWTQGNCVMCRNKATGELLWKQQVSDDSLLSAPETHGNLVLVASHGNFFALNASDGRTVHSHRLTRKTTGSPFAGPILTLHGSDVFVASRSTAGKSTVWRIRPDTGEVIWKRRVQSPRAMLVSENQVCLRSAELSVLDRHTGKPLWRASIGGCGTVSAREGRIYLADAEDRSRVLVLDGATGRRLAARATAGSCNGIVVDGCMGFLSGNDGSLYAFPIRNRS